MESLRTITALYPEHIQPIALADRADITLVPIAGAKAEDIVQTYPFYSRDTGAKVSDELVSAINAALWNERSRTLLDIGHFRGAEVTTQTALNEVAIPLHPGPERYYREIGVIA